MRRLAVVLVVGVAAGVLLLWSGRAGEQPHGRPPGTAADHGWAGLDAQARCDSALSLVTHPDRWPVRCRWRSPGDLLHGQAFPPPIGPPPYDEPHVEIYVDMADTREDLARAIAHELGHMHHTRDPDFVDAWLEARNLPPATPSEAWTEDYAEVFAALFGPPADHWRAPTPRPSPEALASLRDRFFS